MKVTYTSHTFHANETIQAVIRQYNHLSLSKDILKALMVQYNELNNYAIARPGQKVKIPVLTDIEQYRPWQW